MNAPPPISRITEEDRTRIAAFIAEGPLYGKLEVPGERLDGDTLDQVMPSEIRKYCASKKCEFVTAWMLKAIIACVSDAHAEALFECRNCALSFVVWLHWTYGARWEEQRVWMQARLKAAEENTAISIQQPQHYFQFRKVGQDPAPTIHLSPDLVKALGAHAELYRRGVISRNQSYGIGALGYFRRIVEETIDDMLGLLAEALRVTEAPVEEIQRVEDAKIETIFERKAKIAAAALPADLRPGGINPFSSLHDLYSKGLHGLSDEACVATVDRLRADVEIIFKTLKTHVAERNQYAEAARRLGQRQSEA